MLCDALILALSEGTDDFVVYCDASNQGFGCVLMQRNKVIAYASRQLKIYEKNYATHDLELGAMFKRKEDGRLYVVERIWVPVYGNLRTLITNEAHTSKYSVHPGAEKIQSRTLETLGIALTARDSRLEMGEYHYGLHMKTIKKRLTRLYINEIVARHGVLVSIISERDSYFTSRFWHSLQKALGTRLDLSTTYHPKTDVQSKRTIQTLEDMLRACAIDFGGKWDTHLPLVV
ncbi:putative reverse transcriptase domain-containing protein [Tanacetum coccineum]|uniref:Reverse transcriptase domain-containing protein n=1 Tax=Tanacetum coccineum TaxID=301880 RepID=A0ABQ4Y500_9ASTR